MGTMLEVSKTGGLTKCSASRGQRQVFGDVWECRQKWQTSCCCPNHLQGMSPGSCGLSLWFIDDQLEWLRYLPLLRKTNPLSSLTPGYGQICFNSILGMMRFGCDVNKTETTFAFGELKCTIKNKKLMCEGFCTSVLDACLHEQCLEIYWYIQRWHRMNSSCVSSFFFFGIYFKSFVPLVLLLKVLWIFHAVLSWILCYSVCCRKSPSSLGENFTEIEMAGLCRSCLCGLCSRSCGDDMRVCSRMQVTGIYEPNAGSEQSLETLLMILLDKPLHSNSGAHFI